MFPGQEYEGTVSDFLLPGRLEAKAKARGKGFDQLYTFREMLKGLVRPGLSQTMVSNLITKAFGKYLNNISPQGLHLRRRQCATRHTALFWMERAPQKDGELVEGTSTLPSIAAL